MAADTVTNLRRAWERALRQYLDAKLTLEAQIRRAGGSARNAGASVRCDRAREHLLSLAAPDLSAVVQKLETIWPPRILFKDDPESAAMRRVIGDLRRLNFELTSQGTADEWVRGRSTPDPSGDETREPGDPPSS